MSSRRFALAGGMRRSARSAYLVSLAHPLELAPQTNLKLAVSASRRLRSDYSGYAFNVKELGGGTFLDVGWVVDDLDQAAIATHCGASVGLAWTQYDQGPLGADLTSLGDTRAMVIYDGAAVPMIGTVPATDGSGQSSPVMQANTGLGLTGNPGLDIFFVVESWAVGVDPFRLGQSTSGAYLSADLTASNTIRIYFGDGQALWTFSGLDFTAEAHVIHIRGASGGGYEDYEVYVDGVLGTAGTTINGTNTINLADENVHFPTSLGGSYQGKNAECLVYGVASGNALTTGQASLLVTNMAKHHGII